MRIVSVRHRRQTPSTQQESALVVHHEFVDLGQEKIRRDGMNSKDGRHQDSKYVIKQSYEKIYSPRVFSSNAIHPLTLVISRLSS